MILWFPLAGLLMYLTIGAAILSAMRPSRPERPIACNPSVSWDAIDEAIRQGCCVTDDMLPPGEPPASVSFGWYGRMLERAGDDGEETCPRRIIMGS